MKTLTIAIKTEDLLKHPYLKKAVRAYEQSDRGEKRTAFFNALQPKTQPRNETQPQDTSSTQNEVSILRDLTIHLLTEAQRENK